MSAGERFYTLKRNKKLEDFAVMVKTQLHGKKGEDFFKKNFSSLSYQNFKLNYAKGQLTPSCITDLAQYLGVDESDLKGPIVKSPKRGRKKKSNDDPNQLSLSFEPQKTPTIEELAKSTGKMVGDLVEMWCLVIGRKMGL